MSRTPDFDDPYAYERRWGRLSRDQVATASAHDPLLFVADHLALADRQAGAVGLYFDLGPHRPPTIAVVTDGPHDPDLDSCLTMLVDAVSRIDGQPNEEIEDLEPGMTHVEALGVVTHRHGRPHVQDADRRWAQALDGTARWFGFEPIGVLVRTAAGALVRVPPTPLAEEDGARTA